MNRAQRVGASDVAYVGSVSERWAKKQTLLITNRAVASSTGFVAYVGSVSERWAKKQTLLITNYELLLADYETAFE